MRILVLLAQLAEHPLNILIQCARGRGIDTPNLHFCDGGLAQMVERSLSNRGKKRAGRVLRVKGVRFSHGAFGFVPH